MVQFSYTAKQGPHRLVQGIVEAETLNTAVAEVVERGYAPVDVSPVPITKDQSPRKPMMLQLPRKVTYADKVFFIRQISDLISAGVPMIRALTLTGRQTHNGYLQETIAKMSEYVRDGGMLSDAMRRCPDVFPRLYVNLIQAGETSGRLGEVLNRLADLTQHDLEARSQVLSSLIYPSLIMVVGSGTIFALLTWVVPRLADIFTDLEESLPIPTMILLGVSHFLSRFWIFIVVLLIAGIFSLRRLTAKPRGRLWFDERKLRLPLVGPMIRSVETGRFARTLSTLLANGVSIVRALESTALVAGNEVVRREINAMTEAVRNGSRLNGALRKSSIFPETVVTMVAVGEESGQVYQGLDRIAEYFERQTQRYIKTMTTLLEPLLIFLLGLVVGFVVLAMLMPLLKMNMIIR